MTIPPHLRSLPKEFALSADPIDVNPFSREDVRHKVWADATRKAEEEVFRLLSQYTPEIAFAAGQDFFHTVIAFKFDAWAKRGIHVLWSEGAVRHYDAWLVSWADAWLGQAAQFYESKPPPGSAERLMLDLGSQLARQVQYWKAEARRYLAEQELHAGQAVKVQSKSDRVGGPKLAAWLKIEMDKRDHITVHRLHVLTSLDHKTIKAILAGGLVNEVRLRKLADGLGVPIQDLPTD